MFLIKAENLNMLYIIHNTLNFCTTCPFKKADSMIWINTFHSALKRKTDSLMKIWGSRSAIYLQLWTGGCQCMTIRKCLSAASEQALSKLPMTHILCSQTLKAYNFIQDRTVKMLLWCDNTNKITTHHCVSMIFLCNQHNGTINQVKNSTWYLNSMLGCPSSIFKKEKPPSREAQKNQIG